VFNKLIFIIFTGLLHFEVFAFERIEGSEITLVPPAFLKPSSNFSGYIEEEYATSIVINEIHKPLRKIINSLTKEVFASKGVILLSSENVSLGDNKATLLKLTQTAHELEYTKWLVFFGNNTHSVMVAASFQTALSENISKELKHSILTTRWDRSTNIDFFKGLSFRVNETKYLKIAKQFEEGLILSKDGAQKMTSNESPYSFITPVKPQHDEFFDMDNHSQVARGILMASRDYSDIEILSQKQTKINNLHAEVILAKVFDMSVKKWKFIHFSMLISENNYYAILSVADFKKREVIETDFDSLLASFVIKNISH